MTERLPFHFSLSCVGEGNGNPLQCSCLENPRDGGAWWAAVYGVAQIGTRLKWLISSSRSRSSRDPIAKLVTSTIRRWHPTPVLLLGKSHGWRSLVGCSPWDREELDTTERLHFHFSLSCTGEGNSNPLQCSCLENPRDGGAWWAAVYGVAQIRTWLKRLSSSSSNISLLICSSKNLNFNKVGRTDILVNIKWEASAWELFPWERKSSACLKTAFIMKQTDNRFFCVEFLWCLECLE